MLKSHGTFYVTFSLLGNNNNTTSVEPVPEELSCVPSERFPLLRC